MGSQRRRGVIGSAEEGDVFGGSLVAADFGRDGHAALAVGALGKNKLIGVQCDPAASHAVVVLCGSDSGLTSAGSQIWIQGMVIKSIAEAAEGFGRSLAAAGLGKVYTPACGRRPPNDGQPVDAGTVNVIYGFARRLTSTGNELWNPDRPGIKGNSSDADGFASSVVAAGNLGKSGQADLAIGVPYVDVGEAEDAGVVHVIWLVHRFYPLSTSFGAATRPTSWARPGSISGAEP